MKELIPKDDFGIFADGNDVARVDSLFVARLFKKRHDHILRDIAKITAPTSGLSEEFTKDNFRLDTYKDSTGRRLRCYQMTRDGFVLLTMGYTGIKAMRFKELYIRRFNEMEEQIKTMVSARKEFPLLSENIKLAHEEPKPYHYTNEIDMINRLAIGMSARQFREKNGIPKGESIRPYLTAEQLKKIDLLQKIDCGLLLVVPEYEARKKELEKYLALQAERKGA